MKCSALLDPDKGLCRNFFPTNGSCYGHGGEPFCLSEKKCARLYPETGWAVPEARVRLTREFLGEPSK